MLVTAKIENLYDVERGELPADQVHTVVVTNALVDTGASTLLLPKSMIQQLGLRYLRIKESRGIGGTVSMPVYSAVRLTIQGRDCAVDVGEIRDELPVCVGQIPLEAMDWVVDPMLQRLIGNPEHGGQEMIDAFTFT